MAASNLPSSSGRREPSFRRLKGKREQRGGSGHLVWTTIVSCLLLAPNFGIVLMAIPLLRAFSEWFESPRLTQTLIFTLPIGLLFFEWWVFDRVVDWVWPEQSEQSAQPAPPAPPRARKPR